MEEEKKAKAEDISGLSEGLKELIALPSQTGQTAASSSKTPDANQEKDASRRPKTQKEQELDSLIAKRQEIIEQLKARNPVAAESRKKLVSLIPLIRGKGASKAMALADEMKKLEFAISTEAYTPKKEKELLKRMRQIKAELSKHQAFDETRKKVDAERSLLNSTVSEIRHLERELAKVRRACDETYASVIAERKEEYEKRQKRRQERTQKRFDDLRRRVSAEKKRVHDTEIKKYLKDYDDTVSMEEICVIEKKEKKKKED